MILDSSAVLAILLREPGWEALFEAIEGALQVGISASTLAEATIVMSAKLQKDARPLLSRFAQEVGLTVLPFQEAAAIIAVDAWLRYGKGRHPAALNYGDCLSYAAAKTAGAPLLCKGQDFAQTDLVG